MALGTITEVKKGVIGDLQYAILDVQLTSGANYTTGGEVFDVAQVPGLKSVLYGVDFLGAGGGTGYLPSWDSTNKKLMVFQGDNANAAAAPAVQVPASTNLSAVTVRIKTLGK